MIVSAWKRLTAQLEFVIFAEWSKKLTKKCASMADTVANVDQVSFMFPWT